MKSLLVVMAALTLSAATAWTQTEPIRIYTDPRPPSLEALNRLSLELAWSIRLKTYNTRDGIFSIQMIPDTGKQRLLVQTRRGDVVALDAETGDPLWVTHVGREFEIERPVAFNAETVFAVRREQLFALDRKTGKQLLWTIEKDSGLPVWGITLESIPSAGLVADETRLFVCMDSRVSSYLVPDFQRIAKLQAKEEAAEADKRMPSPQVIRDWTRVLAPHRFSQTPMLTHDNLGLVADDGTFIVLSKLDATDHFGYQVEKAVVAPAAQNGGGAYIGSLDYQLYSFDMDRARLSWRFTATAPVVLPVQATDRDVFVAPDRVGLFRVDRATGHRVWLARDAQRFLATNGKFVYAFDRFGHLLVLDYARGTQLAKWDTRDYVFPFANTWTDRLYLAAHNGLIVCLRHRDYPRPLKIKTPPGEEAVKPPKGKGKKDGGKGVPKLGENAGAGLVRIPDGMEIGQARDIELTPRLRRVRNPALFRRPALLAAEGRL